MEIGKRKSKTVVYFDICNLFTISPVSFFVDIAYLFFFSKKKLTFVEIKSWFGK